jgi:acyl-CoA thioesterase
MSSTNAGLSDGTSQPEEASAAASQVLAERSVHALYQADGLTRAFEMRIDQVAPGRARVTMRVRADMTNGHGTCHGGVLFALADSAFAFACNSHNKRTVAAAASIEFLQAARQGDELTAAASETWRSRRSGLYDVTIVNQKQEQIAVFRGRAHQLDGQVIGT